MITTISILAVALLATVVLLAFAPMADFRRRGLKAVLIAAAVVGALGMGVCFAAFIGLMFSSNPALSKLSMHALMAAIAMPLVLGMAALAFGAMAATWPNVFERTNDRFAANIYVLIGVSIVVACVSGSLRADWPGYLVAMITVPLLPAMANRRLRQSRAAGFGAKAVETFRTDRPEQAETRFAEPVIAARAPATNRRPSPDARPTPATARQSASSARPIVERPKTTSAPTGRAPSAPAAAKASRRSVMPPSKAPAATPAKLAMPSAMHAGRMIGELRRRVASAIAPAEAPSPGPVAVRRELSKSRTSPPQDRPAAAGRLASNAAAARQTSPANEPSVRRTAAGSVNSHGSPRTAIKSPETGTRPSKPVAKPPMPKPSLLPPGVTPAAPRARVQAPALTKTDDRRKPTVYPLTAPFEPGSDRWATFIDGVLTTETGIVRKVAARSTQALEDVSGAA
jgi:hypothetical protein